MYGNGKSTLKKGKPKLDNKNLHWTIQKLTEEMEKKHHWTVENQHWTMENCHWSMEN